MVGLVRVIASNNNIVISLPILYLKRRGSIKLICKLIFVIQSINVTLSTVTTLGFSTYNEQDECRTLDHIKQRKINELVCGRNN